MDTIMTNKVTTISEFKKNPNLEVNKAGDEPFAVLTNNRPTFYVLSPKLFEEISEILWEAEIAPVVLKRMKNKRKSIRVSLEDLK